MGNQSLLNLNYLTLVVAIINLALGLIVLGHDRKQALNRDFFYFTFLIALWCGTIFYFQEFNQSLFFLKSQYATGGLVLVLAFPWILRLTKSKVKKTTNALLVILGVIISVVPFVGGS